MVIEDDDLKSLYELKSDINLHTARYKNFEAPNSTWEKFFYLYQCDGSVKSSTAN